MPLLGTSAIQNARPLAELAPQGLLAGGLLMRRKVELAVVMMQKVELELGRPQQIPYSTHLHERVRERLPILDETHWMAAVMGPRLL